MKRPDKRKLINWDKKNNDDEARISKRLEGRSLLDDKATTKNDSKKIQVAPPRSNGGAPLLKLRKKIKEVYDEDEDEEDEVYIPFFNISLIDDDEREYDSDRISKKNRKDGEETLRITREQQMAGKLNMIMNAAVMADEAGLPSNFTKKDALILDSPEYNPKKIRRKVIHQKIEEPLDLIGKLDEDNLKPSLDAIRRANQELPEGSLKGMPAKDLPELEEQESPEEMAKLILKKSGRKNPKKSLVELAKEINRMEQINPELRNNKNKEKE